MAKAITRNACKKMRGGYIEKPGDTKPGRRREGSRAAEESTQGRHWRGARRMADGDGDERGNAVAVKRQPQTSPTLLLVCIYIYLLYTKQECIPPLCPSFTSSSLAHPFSCANTMVTTHKFYTYKRKPIFLCKTKFFS